MVPHQHNFVIRWACAIAVVASVSLASVATGQIPTVGEEISRRYDPYYGPTASDNPANRYPATLNMEWEIDATALPPTLSDFPAEMAIPPTLSSWDPIFFHQPQLAWGGWGWQGPRWGPWGGWRGPIWGPRWGFGPVWSRPFAVGPWGGWSGWGPGRGSWAWGARFPRGVPLGPRYGEFFYGPFHGFHGPLQSTPGFHSYGPFLPPSFCPPGLGDTMGPREYVVPGSEQLILPGKTEGEISIKE
ncbi:MAG: hypothetical protein SFX18_14485 [Pirellulales bacterium]|nr:hypothetical protein [Pirellulales bacterium]